MERLEMLISGIDNVLRVPTPTRGTSQDRALEFFAARWPNCVVETDELPLAVRPSDANFRHQLSVAQELFIYPTAEAAASWNEDGATPENSNQMIHLLFTAPDPLRAESMITAVIGDRTPEMEQLVEDLRRTLQRTD